MRKDKAMLEIHGENIPSTTVSLNAFHCKAHIQSCEVSAFAHTQAHISTLTLTFSFAPVQLKMAPSCVEGVGTVDGEQVERINSILSLLKRLKFMTRLSK